MRSSSWRGRNRRPPDARSTRPWRGLESLLARCGEQGDTGRLAGPSAAGAIRRVDCHLEFEVTTPAVLAVQVAVASTAGDILGERLGVTLDGAEASQPV